MTLKAFPLTQIQIVLFQILYQLTSSGLGF